MVSLAASAANSSSSRYSGVNGSASKAGSGPWRRSAGTRSRSVGALERAAACESPQPSSSPSFQRMANSARTAPEEACAASSEVAISTSRGKSPGPPGVGSAQTSSSSKSCAISWIRQGRDLWAVFASLIQVLRPPGRGMSNRVGEVPRMHRWAGASAVATALLFGAANALWAFQQPAQGASGAELVRFYEALSTQIVIGGLLSLVSIALFV